MGCELIIFKDGAHAIICGRKDHECNDKGPEVFSFTNGFVGPLFEAAKQAKINLEMCTQDKLYFLHEKEWINNGSSVSCSICGSSFQFNIGF